MSHWNFHQYCGCLFLRRSPILHFVNLTPRPITFPARFHTELINDNVICLSCVLEAVTAMTLVQLCALADRHEVINCVCCIFCTE